MVTKPTLEEALCSSAITHGLQIHINNLAILVYCSPKIVLLAIELDEDFADEEGVAVALMPSFQASGRNGSKLDTPETDCFAADSDASLSQPIFDIAEAQAEAIVEPKSLPQEVLWVLHS
jgi:hypothetical protein